MKAEEALKEIIRLQADMQQVLIESTDANKWKEYYDKQLLVLESYARQEAVEFGKQAFEAGYKYSTGHDNPDWEAWYDEWLELNNKQP